MFQIIHLRTYLLTHRIKKNAGPTTTRSCARRHSLASRRTVQMSKISRSENRMPSISGQAGYLRPARFLCKPPFSTFSSLFRGPLGTRENQHPFPVKARYFRPQPTLCKPHRETFSHFSEISRGQPRNRVSGSFRGAKPRAVQSAYAERRGRPNRMKGRNERHNITGGNHAT